MSRNFREHTDEDGDVCLEVRVTGFYGGVIFSHSSNPDDSGWWVVSKHDQFDSMVSKDGVISDETLMKIRDILNKRFPK